MKSERTNISHPIWRKKVDSSIWGHNVTTIPNWACKMWDIGKIFKGMSSQKNPKTEVTILFNNKKWDGNVTWQRGKTKNPKYRLWFDGDLTESLKEIFLMSYMRDIENNIRGKVSSKIEDDIPFWEFLDIEFDKTKMIFIFTAHYTQKPTFPNLFKSLVQSPKIKEIDDKISGKEKSKIYKQDWRPIEEYVTEIGAENVIYMLMNKSKKLFYIGEANDLISRFSSGKYKNKWEYYRYDKLPTELEEHRLELERSLIKSFATIINNTKNIKTHNIKGYTLSNIKIDM